MAHLHNKAGSFIAPNATRPGPWCILHPLRLKQRSSSFALHTCKTRRSQLGCRRRYCHISADSAIVPNVPFPGDDQGSIIYSALSDIEEAAAGALQKAEEALDDAVTPSTSGRGTSGPAESLNGSMPDPKGKPPVPHRWIIVGAMALAFVLCNMDKVNLLASHYLHHFRAWVGFRGGPAAAGRSLIDTWWRAGEHVSGSHPYGSRAGVEPY